LRVVSAPTHGRLRDGKEAAKSVVDPPSAFNSLATFRGRLLVLPTFAWA